MSLRDKCGKYGKSEHLGSFENKLLIRKLDWPGNRGKYDKFLIVFQIPKLVLYHILFRILKPVKNAANYFLLNIPQPFQMLQINF